LAFRWPDSPLTVSVRVDPNRRPGADAIEVCCARRLVLSPGVHPALGARFEQID
jgi:hypothetical protein